MKNGKGKTRRQRREGKRGKTRIEDAAMKGIGGGGGKKGQEKAEEMREDE